jgi:hypothetical protein
LRASNIWQYPEATHFSNTPSSSYIKNNDAPATRLSFQPFNRPATARVLLVLHGHDA